MLTYLYWLLGFAFLAMAFGVGVASVFISTWREVRKYEADKRHDETTEMLASQENLARGGTEFQRAMSEAIRKGAHE